MADRTIRFKSTRDHVSPYNRPTRFSLRLNPPRNNPTVAPIARPRRRSPYAALAVYAPTTQITSYCRTRDSRPATNQATRSPSDPECFLQRLSKKLRCKIWDYSHPRTIEIDIYNGLVCSRSPSPITFRINKESRYEFIKLYTLHENFYISGTEYAGNTPYPLFNAAVDSVLVKDSFMGYNPATSRVPLGFYAVPSVPRDWSAISQSPQAYICFRNLTEVVFQGGSEGLVTQRNVTKCKQVVRACFETSLSTVGNVRTRKVKATGDAMKIPEIRVIMPNGLGYERAFNADQLGMESMEERTWVLNFIQKVDDSRE
ncbi:hypothetical protein EYC84_002477 [Monilinia fructicola]|uniref:2EXR domain-containing protein n=1 Tax=Monilinia fructicola TaxID=38448 RepID=A0A5M9JN49_MONFR|nr:hypothetical protein EYC84_002477 [Monilinia fructicola]